MFRYLVVIGLIASTPCASDQLCKNKRKGKEWDYGDNGPSTWSKVAPQCKGANQSPIDIVTNGKLTKGNYKNFVNQTNFLKKPEVPTYKMINNGHTLQIKLPENNSYELTKGENVYVPIHIHIHFDSINRRGSEHMINGKKYFAEIQIVHRNKKYTEEDICNHPDVQVNGVLILAIFVDLKKEIDLKRTLYGFEEEYRSIMGVGTSLVMDIISAAAEKILMPGSKTKIDAFPLAWLFPHSEREGAIYDYVNYHGSLTTPPCLEIVDWIVLTGKTLATNKEAGRKMLHVKDISEEQMSGGSRPVQDINGRKVYGVKGEIKSDS